MNKASRIRCYLCGNPATHTREWPVLGNRFLCDEHDPVPHMPRDHIVQPVDLRPFFAAGVIGAIALAPSVWRAGEILQEQGAADAAIIFGGSIIAIIITAIIGGSIAAGNSRRKA